MKKRRFGHFHLQILALLLFLFIPHLLAQAVLLAYLLVSLLCYIYARLQYAGARAERNFTLARAYCTRPVEVRVTVRNRSPFTLHHLLVSDHRGDMHVQGNTVALFSLKPRGTAELTYRVHADRRGYYRLGPFVLAGSDPLGMFPWEKEDEITARVIVYPWIYSLPLAHRHGLPSGSIRTDDPSYEDVTSYRSLREYRPGDDLRRVNWKVSARLAALYTMQYTPSLRFSAVILLNLTENDYLLRYRSTLIENAIEAAASLLVLCLTLRQEAGLLCDGLLDGERRVVYFPAAGHSGNAVPMLETLARIGTVPRKKSAVEDLFSPAVRLAAASRVYYVGPVPEEESLKRLISLRRRGFHPECFFCGRPDRGTGADLNRLGLPHRFIEDVEAAHGR